ncbi:MAG: ComF family protein [Dehalococcoidales bacterium]|nr:ComF family protein [Dehalococcoidales bacterium]
MLRQAAKLKREALDLLFPEWCIGCGREGDFICPSCRKLLARLLPPLCPQCGRPQPEGNLCSNCLSWSAAIDGMRAPFRFEGLIRSAIHQLKYRNLRALSESLAGFLGDYLAANPLSATVLVPVPIHPRRLRERGYNQSQLLAQELAKLTGMPLVADCLVRERPALPQARTGTVAERRSNVAGAFACRDRRLAGEAVLLIDDVATSGATLDACAAALKEAGASSVWGLTLAREI